MTRLFHYCAVSALLTLLAVLSGIAPAQAQGRVDALYTASLAGVPVGKGGWMIEINEGQYTSASSGVTTGLLRVFASGEGSGVARGYVSNGTLIPSAYGATITADKKTEEMRMTIVGGVVKDLLVDPPLPPHPERIPVTEAHYRGVVDPMTASMVRVPGTGNPVSADACNNRTTAIFDGRMRYDLTVSFKRIEEVKADKGYAGPAVVCAVYFNPVAGYIPGRAAIKYLTKQRDMEVWMVPVAGTRVVVPFRIAIPTPLGTAALQATQFVTVAQSARSQPASSKGQ
jgi:hypothetical protein